MSRYKSYIFKHLIDAGIVFILLISLKLFADFIMIVWITGLPGSGKTTLAKRVKSILEKRTSKNIVLLDGDNIRSILPFETSYAKDDRIKLGLFYSELALLIEKSNCIVICSFVALFRSVHDHTRLKAKDYYEIFLDPPFEELVNKNKKGLYSKNSEYFLSQLKQYEFSNNSDFKSILS